MKLLLSATLLLRVASAQLAPIRLRASEGPRSLKPKQPLHDVHYVTQPPIPIKEEEEWQVDEEVDEEFGRFEDDLFVVTDDISLSLSISYSMPTMEPTADVVTDMPSPAPYMVVTDMPTPEDSTFIPTTITNAPTSKSGKQPKPVYHELFTYSFNIPDEYSGLFHLYEKQDKKSDPSLLTSVSLEASGSGFMYLPQSSYIVQVINVNSTVGFCCNGTTIPGWVSFTYGNIQYDTIYGGFEEKNGKEEFVSEFHKDVDKVEVGESGAVYEFDFKL
jgi:hypothetical protein